MTIAPSQPKTVLDDLDRSILRALQRDATQPLEALARAVGSSRTPVWNRIRRMRKAGIIKAQVAIVDAEAVDLGTCFFVLVRTAHHDPDWLERFLAALGKHPEIVAAHRLAGEVDYILQVRVSDPRAYDAFYRRLIEDVSIYNVTSLLSMEVIRETTALPI